MTIKQVIVMRKDLNMRKGKMIAQGAHASMVFLVEAVRNGRHLSDVELEWLNGLFTKICVSVNSEEELFEIQQQCLESNIKCNIIKDSGLTEFGGVPTYTCLAIGPDNSAKIDKITGELKLL